MIPITDRMIVISELSDDVFIIFQLVLRINGIDEQAYFNHSLV